ncbi:Juvenile hormone epoxide hydrolase 1-like Protein [Tribolium castaneum]|uniref:Epoxide hydrolase n=1 Tax=Tribolium castaneum TaxID=7070 RepID=D6WGJ0_TRICA|nr:Juvenile hormone epoxide hydrolase 1-like Protein [Tribolium castaneum]
MGLIIKLVLVIITVLTAYQISKLFETPPVPKLENTWWGPRDPSKEDTAIKPFKINVSDEVLKDLQHRLANARPLVPPLEGAQQHYGMNTKLLGKIIDHWRTKYNWREREKFLNQYPQFTARNFVFEVIVPSLPGYGFSEAAVRPGLGPIEMSVVFKNFMKRIGFDKYYIQGGDWGALIVQNMATLFPEHVLGVHSNMCFVNTPLSNLKLLLGSIYPPLIVSKEMESKIYPLSAFYSNILLEMGYMHLQATKPDTVGVALNDSPVGLAAYILEKFTTWTNADWKDLEDGGLTKKYKLDDLLDNVMIYWVSNSITTSVRLYSEAFNKAQLSLGVERIPLKVPSACAVFRNEIAHQPPALLSEKYHNLVHYSEKSDGGHFAAFEVPKILAEDIFVGVEKMIAANSPKK